MVGLRDFRASRYVPLSSLVPRIMSRAWGQTSRARFTARFTVDLLTPVASAVAVSKPFGLPRVVLQLATLFLCSQSSFRLARCSASCVGAQAEGVGVHNTLFAVLVCPQLGDFSPILRSGGWGHLGRFPLGTVAREPNSRTHKMDDLPKNSAPTTSGQTGSGSPTTSGNTKQRTFQLAVCKEGYPGGFRFR